MNSVQFVGVLEMGLIYGYVALGVYLSLRVLDFPDLGVDGTFPLGAAVFAALTVNGFSPLSALALATVAGALAGYATAWLSTHLRFLNLLSGILVMTALYSVNLRIMGRPNVSLLGEPSLFDSSRSSFENYAGEFWRVIPLAVLLGILAIGLDRFLKTDTGLALRATGNNPRMARAQGIRDRFMIGLGLALANAFVALGGALFTQINGYADVTMGVGTVVIGIAAVIIGEALISASSLGMALFACVAGAIAYRFLISFALSFGGTVLRSSDLNLVTAVLVGFAMLLPDIGRRLGFKKT